MQMSVRVARRTQVQRYKQSKMSQCDRLEPIWSESFPFPLVCPNVYAIFMVKDAGLFLCSTGYVYATVMLKNPKFRP